VPLSWLRQALGGGGEPARIAAEDMRLVASATPLQTFELTRVKDQSQDSKPRGLWYACGLEWLEWCAVEMPGWLGSYEHFYHLQLDDSRMLFLRSVSEILDFTHRYGTRDEYRIDWPAVARDFDGIEICPYQWDLRRKHETSWYYPWDVASGCIWRPEAIADIVPVDAAEMAAWIDTKARQCRYEPNPSLTAYHGTKAPMEQPRAFRDFRGMDFGPGFYLSTSAEDADWYGHYIYEAEVALERPLRLTAEDYDQETVERLQRWLRISDEDLGFYAHPMVGIFVLAATLMDIGMLTPAELVAALQGRGYDGVLVDQEVINEATKVDAKGDYVILWSPEQIASWERVR